MGHEVELDVIEEEAIADLVVMTPEQAATSNGSIPNVEHAKLDPTTDELYFVRVSVSDTGMGLSSDECKLLFAPYRQFSMGKMQRGTH